MGLGASRQSNALRRSLLFSSLPSRPSHEQQGSPGAREQSSLKVLTGPGLVAQGPQGPQKLPATARPPRKDAQDPAQLRLRRMQEAATATALEVLG